MINYLLSNMIKFPSFISRRCVHAMSAKDLLPSNIKVPTLYGWDMSYFSAKVALYFKFKGIAFNKHYISLLDFNKIQKNVGATVMPVVVTSDDKWIQDSRNIIDQYENTHPTPSVFPTTPNKRFISCLLEAWGDEFWIPMAMHYRWSFPESQNEDIFRAEAGENLLPYFPSFIQKYAANKPVKTLRKFLPVVGVVPEQYDVISEWTINMLNLLENHFKFHNYLLGNNPTIGDFGLVGPLIPHLARDSYPNKHILNKEKYPFIFGWIDRMENSHDAKDEKPIFSSHNDTIPTTLEPILRHIFNEFIPMIQQMVPHLEKLKTNEKFYIPDDNGKNTLNKTLPRMLSTVQFPIYTQNTSSQYTRATLPFNLYKMQVVLDEYHNMSKGEQSSIRNYLENLNKHTPSYGSHNKFDTKLDYSKSILDMIIPRLDRINVRVKFA